MSSSGTPIARAEGDEPHLDATDTAQRRTLILVLGINLLQAVGVGAMGVIADSTGLLGAAFDNLADGAVYGVSLYAATRSDIAKARAATLSGVVLIALGLALLGEVIRRFLTGADPTGMLMILTALVNAAVNVVCLKLLRAHRNDGVHVQASWIFTQNDMLANIGIAASGVAVIIFASPVPDLLIGLVVVAIGIRGGWEILQRVRSTRGKA